MSKLRASPVTPNRWAQSIGCFVSVPVAFALGLSLLYIVDLLAGAESALLLALPILAIAGLAGYFLTQFVQRRLITTWDTTLRVSLDEPSLTMSNPSLDPGDSFSVTYDQRILRPLRIERISIDVVRRTREPRSVVGIGSFDPSPRYWDRVAHKLLRPGGEYAPGHNVHEEVTLTIPAGGGKTIFERGLGRQVEWLVRVRLKLAQQAEFLREFPLEVESTRS